MFKWRYLLLDTLLNCLTDEADIHKLTLYWNWFYDKFITFVQNGYVFNIYINPEHLLVLCGCDRMIFEFITTYAITTNIVSSI